MSKSGRGIFLCIAVVGLGMSILRLFVENECVRHHAADGLGTVGDQSSVEDGDADMVEYIAMEKIDSRAIVVEEVRDGGAIIRASQADPIRTSSRQDTRAALELASEEMTRHGIVLVPFSKVDLPDGISEDVERLCVSRSIDLFVKEPLGRQMPLGQSLLWLVKSMESSGEQRSQ